MVHGISATVFACLCSCPGAQAAKAMGVQPWAGREAQQYKGKTWWTMWAQVIGVGSVNHFQTTNGEQEPVKTLGVSAPANRTDAKLASMKPTPRIAQVVVEEIEEDIPF